ncbi:hypothetical protein GQX73_g10520 [Xylaria multiplex]|uniref:Glycoprotein X n=1 Tax=Xylaria multiplex TaxID=323545 RepID=A0A7C8MI45_9PEZI|nr:hypothetical protein GQX73_g10520 [Xylaria multiplex]
MILAYWLSLWVGVGFASLLNVTSGEQNQCYSPDPYTVTELQTETVTSYGTLTVFESFYNSIGQTVEEDQTVTVTNLVTISVMDGEDATQQVTEITGDVAYWTYPTSTVSCSTKPWYYWDQTTTVCVTITSWVTTTSTIFKPTTTTTTKTKPTTITTTETTTKPTTIYQTIIVTWTTTETDTETTITTTTETDTETTITTTTETDTESTTTTTTDTELTTTTTTDIETITYTTVIPTTITEFVPTTILVPTTIVIDHTSTTTEYLTSISTTSIFITSYITLTVITTTTATDTTTTTATATDTTTATDTSTTTYTTVVPTTTTSVITTTSLVPTTIISDHTSIITSFVPTTFTYFYDDFCISNYGYYYRDDHPADNLTRDSDHHKYICYGVGDLSHGLHDEHHQLHNNAGDHNRVADDHNTTADYHDAPPSHGDILSRDRNRVSHTDEYPRDPSYSLRSHIKPAMGLPTWDSIPDETYVCEDRAWCADSPAYPVVRWRDNETSYYPPTEGYYNLAPEAFGLSDDIFAIHYTTTVSDGVTITISTGNWVSQTQLTAYPPSSTSTATAALVAPGPVRRRSAVLSKRALTLPAICYDTCNNVNIEAQSVGKTRDLCAQGSPFLSYLQACEDCIAANLENVQDTRREYLEPAFAQYLGYCSSTNPSSASNGGGGQGQVSTTTGGSTISAAPPASVTTAEPIPPTSTSTSTSSSAQESSASSTSPVSSAITPTGNFTTPATVPSPTFTTPVPVPTAAAPPAFLRGAGLGSFFFTLLSLFFVII